MDAGCVGQSGRLSLKRHILLSCHGCSTAMMEVFEAQHIRVVLFPALMIWSERMKIIKTESEKVKVQLLFD